MKSSSRGLSVQASKKKIENLWVRRRHHGFKRTKISYLHHPLPQIHRTQLFLDVTSLQQKTLIVNFVGLEFPGIPPAANPNCELCGSWEFPIIPLAANCNVNFVDLEFQRILSSRREVLMFDKVSINFVRMRLLESQGKARKNGNPTQEWTWMFCTELVKLDRFSPALSFVP